MVLPHVSIDAPHLKRYAAVCGFVPSMGVPLTYPQLLTFPLVMSYLCGASCPWPAMGTVHLANAIQQHRPLALGDVVRVELSSGQLYSHDKGQVFTLELRIFRDGEWVWQATQTLLRLGVLPAVGQPYSELQAQDIFWHKVEEIAAPANMGRRYAAVSGDYNPIHLSQTSARLFGFRQAIAHGLWAQARSIAALLPPEPMQQATLVTAFKKPVCLPARPTLWQGRHHGNISYELRDAQGQATHLRGRLFPECLESISISSFA